MSAGEARAHSTGMVVRPDWDDVKDKVMERLVYSKFKDHSDLARRLLDTGTRVLIYGNTWHDSYWGVCTCDMCCMKKQHNNLGKLLMKVRNDCHAY